MWSSALGSTPQAWEPGGFVLYRAGAFPCSCFFICLGVYLGWQNLCINRGGSDLGWTQSS